MTQLALLDNGSRIQYGNKVYKTSSVTGFELFKEFLKRNEQLIMLVTSKEGVFVFDGNRFFYKNSKNKRTFTEKGQVGRFYIKSLKRMLERQEVLALGLDE
jgi:hypothetical protein